MSGLRIVIASSAVVLLAIVSVAVPRLVTERLVFAIQPANATHSADSRLDRRTGPGRLAPSADMFEDTSRRMDLRGNEIARPVARYRVDPRGTLYEVHSPQTEVPRLKAPTL